MEKRGGIGKRELRRVRPDLRNVAFMPLRHSVAIGTPKQAEARAPKANQDAAFRQRFQLLFKIVNAVYADLMLTGYSRMKPEDKTIFSFLLALADGRVLTVRNNQSAGQL